MSEINEQAVNGGPDEGAADSTQPKLYHVSFRAGLQPKAASAKLPDLGLDETVIVQTDHGPEPALVCGAGVPLPEAGEGEAKDILAIVRRATPDEIGRYQNLVQREAEAKAFCQSRIQNLNLEMKLLRVERYFNGGKIIFYFSAENRVDFRDLVKSLVQEFRTRVEMRQIGVRHETQMLGGLGCCGRELCCGLFMKDFVPVSIKMAKEQDLPLNPAKISGVCNRLLCCLTHEYDTYRVLKKGMPKLGRTITYDGKPFKVTQCKTLNETVTVMAVDDPSDTRILHREDWEKGSPQTPAPATKTRTEAEPLAETASQAVPKPAQAKRQGPRPGGAPGRPSPSGPGRPPSGARPPQAKGQGPRPGPPAKPQEGRAPGGPKADAAKPGPGRPPRSRRGGRGPKSGNTP